MKQTRDKTVSDFKDTEIGILPSDWNICKLGDIATLNLGRTPSTKNDDFWSSSDHPWISISDLNNDHISFTAKGISDKAFREVFKSEYVPQGTLLMSFKLTIGRVGILDVPALHNEAIVSFLDLDTEVDRDFLGFLLRFTDFNISIDTYLKGKTLNKRKLTNFPIPMPPLLEQRRISNILNIIQNTIAAQDDLIHTLREFKRSSMHQLFTYGADNTTKGTKVSEVGEIPEQWEVCKLGDCIDIVSGQVDPRISPYLEMIHVGPENIESNTGRLLSPSTAEELKLKSGKYFFNNQHVLYSKIRPYLMKVMLPDFEGICSADMYPIQPIKEKLTREYLFQYLLSDIFTTQAISFQERTGIPKINRQQLESIFMPLPPTIAEQNTITSVLSKIDERIAVEEDRKTAQQELFRSILHQLMTGKIRLLSDEGLPQ